MRQIPPRGIGIAEEIHRIADRFDRVDREERFCDAFYLLCVRRHKEQRRAVLVDDPAAVEPVRQLVEDLIVRIVGVALLDLLAVLFAHAIVIRRVCVDIAEHGIGAVRKLFDPRRRKRQCKGMQRFAAGQTQAIIGSELLLLFGVHLFVCRAHGGKQDRICVLPEIPAFLAEIGQLPESAVIEPETAFVAVFFFVTVRYDERGAFAVRGVFHV